MFNAFAKQLTWHFALLQVHKLDKKAWESVEVVDIDIADRKQVNAKVKTKKNKKNVRFEINPNFRSDCHQYPVIWTAIPTVLPSNWVTHFIFM